LDDLVLTAVQLPSNAPAIFFAGRVAARIPFRNGVLCMDPARTKLLRLYDAQVATNGVAAVGPGIIEFLGDDLPPVVGEVLPGSTWFFQGYYRDPGHCVAGANLTNAIAVTFASEPPVGTTRIGGRVFYDWNESGILEVGLINEDVIEGWKVVLSGAGGDVETFTDALGRFEFEVPQDGALYSAMTIAPPPGYIPAVDALWLPTTPTEYAVIADQDARCVDFGHIAFENTPGFARSKGFWHNAGRPLLEDCDPLWREVINDLCLRTNVTNANGDDGTLFTVSMSDSFADAYDELSDFLTSPTNGVLAHNLSMQFCATNLNRSCGFMQETTYIDRELDGVLIPYEVMFDQTRTLLCDPCSANSGPGGDEACRAMLMACLEEWEGTNSEGTRIYTKRDRKREFSTPY